jgi:predicted acylesterase/phospholipase RssA
MEPKPYCDLIMKGGITSGVAYPGAVLKLHEKYDFAAIGGASAGAIAAAMTAAAQYAPDGAGFTRLDDLRTELQQPGLLLRLFRATKETRPLLGLMTATTGPGRQRARVVTRVIGRLWLPLLIWLSGGFALTAMLLGHAGATWGSLTWVSVVVLAVLLTAVAVVSFALVVAARLGRAVTAYLPSSYYGMCLGVTEDGDSSGPALTEWLHEWIQRVAGRPGHEPLTFADLHTGGVELQLITTDVSLTRPVRFSRTEPAARGYHFDVDEFRGLFPAPVVEHLVRTAEPVPTEDGRLLYPLPTGDLPIVVAVRMSLSFPVLLAAIPLWTCDDGRPVRHWISDGGITSNFPIHYFDAWVPGRPTFGLNLVPAPERHDDPAGAVAMYPDKPPAPRVVPITSLAGFGKQIAATMQNWRDTLQSELTGFHDRIAHIGLDPGEGGMNIAMDTGTIARIGRKGECAGEALRDRFDWDTHQTQRYEVFMGLLQDGLAPDAGAVDHRSRTLREAWDSGLKNRFATLAADSPWHAAAAEATGRLLDDAGKWLGPLEGVADRRSFRPLAPLMPPAGMRITPDV